jgi:hypothetical protein
MKATTPKHTPTPWKTRANKIPGYRFTIGAPHRSSGNMGGNHEIPVADIRVTGNEEANAEFIVRAVNAHEELLAAAKSLQALAHAYMKHTQTTEWAGDTEVAKVWRAAEAAIAKAE